MKEWATFPIAGGKHGPGKDE